MFKDYFHNKKAVLFDLDGTVVNSHPLWNEACIEVASNLGFVWRGLNFFSAASLSETWESYLDFTGEDYGVPVSSLVLQTKDKFLSRFLVASPEEFLQEGFWAFINELKSEKSMKIGLVTNSDKDVAEKVINHLNIASVFETILYGDDVKRKKPDSEIYEKAIKNLDLKAKEILCFEDAPAGVKSARGAGLTVIGVRNSLFSERDYPHNLIFVEDFTVFPGNLDRAYKEILQEQMDQLPPKESTEDQ